MKRVIRATINPYEELGIFYDILDFGTKNVIAEGIEGSFGKYETDSDIIFVNYDPKDGIRNKLVRDVGNIIDGWAHTTVNRVIEYLNSKNCPYTDLESIPTQIINYKGLMHEVDNWVNKQFDNTISASTDLYGYSTDRDVLEADLYSYALSKMNRTPTQQQIEEEQLRQDKTNDLINNWVINTANTIQKYLEDTGTKYTTLDSIPISYIPINTLLQNISVLYK